MLLQPAAPDPHVILNVILARTSRRLTAIHRAYAEGRLGVVHVSKTRFLRDHMAALAAQFGDGYAYGSIEPDMLAAIRVFECEANALLCSMHGIDDAREMVA